jgi:hypothetical protein
MRHLFLIFVSFKKIGLQDVFFGRRSVYIVTQLCRGGELFELVNSGKSKVVLLVFIPLFKWIKDD